MNKVIQKCLTIAITLFAVAFISASFSIDSHAASKPKLETTECYVHVDQIETFREDIKCADDYKILSVKSSNPSSVPAGVLWDKKSYYYTADKAGNAKLTIKVKVKGKTYTLTKKIHVNADVIFSSLKYDGKDIYNNDYTPYVKYKKGAKLTWKTNPGYKITATTYTDTKGKEKSFKQNFSPKLSKRQAITYKFDVKNPKGVKYSYSVTIGNY